MQDIVIFANCQGEALGRLLTEALPSTGYSIRWYSNNTRTGRMKDTGSILAAVRDADIVIFQPLHRRHEELSGDSIRAIAQGHVVAFSYIHNSGIAGMCRVANKPVHEYGYIHGELTVRGLLDEGVSVEEVIADFRRGDIDFKLGDRFQGCLDEQRNREKTTEIALVDHISGTFRSKRQFLTHNHPTTDLLTELCRQTKALTGLPIDTDRLEETYDENLAGLPNHRDRCPIGLYSVRALGYEFGPDPGWERNGGRLISMIASDAG